MFSNGCHLEMLNAGKVDIRPVTTKPPKKSNRGGMVQFGGDTLREFSKEAINVPSLKSCV